MSAVKSALATPLFPSVPAPTEALKNPIFLNVGGTTVYHVRKDDSNPRSQIQNYWFSLRDDNKQAVDVRNLPGYDEPEPLPLGAGNAVERSEHWLAALRAEAERVIVPALAAGLFISRLDD